MTYQFTSEQLVKLLQNTCATYEEYRAWPNIYVRSAARVAAIDKILRGMSAPPSVAAEPAHTLVAIGWHVAERLDYLARLTYHHECNIAQPDADEQYAYYEALGEQRALQAVQRVMEGGKP